MRVVGIDIGSTSIKAVELDTAFGRYDIHDYHELKIEPGVSTQDTVKQLLSSLPKQPDMTAVALKGSQATFRNLQLPTRDKKAIQASVGFELDDDLPFPLEQSVYDYTTLSQTGNTTHVHVATTLRKYLEEAISFWSSSGVSPDIITSETWAYRSLINKAVPATTQEQPVLLIQMGHTRTTLYLHWRRMPITLREIRWGGLDLTTAICKKHSIPLEQAEQIKLDHGFVLAPSQKANATPEQIEFAETLSEATQELTRQLRQITLTCKNTTHTSIGTIILSGGTALLPGLPAFLQEEFQIPVQQLHALTATGTSGVNYSEETDAKFALATALALSLVKSPDKTTNINLRKGSYAKQGGGKKFKLGSLRGPVIAFSCICAMMFISFTVQRASYNSQLKKLDAQLEGSIRSFFGNVSKSSMRTYMSSTNTLRTSITKELNKQRELGNLVSPNQHPPLGFLATASMSIPEDVVVDMTQFQVGASPTSAYSPNDPTQASLTFLVSNPQLAERLATILGGKLNNMQRSKVEEATAADGSKRWKITYSGQPTEDAYGR